MHLSGQFIIFLYYLETEKVKSWLENYNSQFVLVDLNALQKVSFRANKVNMFLFTWESISTNRINNYTEYIHWGKADDRNCNYGHPKMADVESGKNLFCRLNCFYNVF
jgi:hypothetical protein